MQEQVNEKTVALYIKTGKLTAEMLQRAMKKLLSQMKKQADRPPHGKQTLKQLMLSLCNRVGKLSPDFMCLFIIDFSRCKGLYQMVG